MMDTETVDKMFSGVELQFESYYKYTFYFTGGKDGYHITTSIGGNSNDIYRLTVDREMKWPFESHSAWRSVFIKKDGESIFEYMDW